MSIQKLLRKLTIYLMTPLLAVCPTMIGVATIGAGALVLTASTSEAQYGQVRRESRRVSRRTSRRVTRRTNYRINTLPRGAAPYYIGGATYYYAGGRYYQPVYQGGSTVYVQVIVE